MFVKWSSHFMHRKVTKACASSHLCLHKFLAGLWREPFALPWAEAAADRAPGAAAQHSEAQILGNDQFTHWAALGWL